MRRTTALLAAIVFLVAANARAEPQRRVQGAATLEDIPPIPADIHETVARYRAGRSAIAEDWLPDGSLLITTRFGATQQVHRVAAPGADRTQLTFFDEPIAGAWAIPGTDRFLFGRDTGGDEWFQLYAQPLAGGASASFTEPGTRNFGPVFTRDGKHLFWTRASKGSGTYSVMAAETDDPASRRVVYSEPNAVAVEDVSDDGSRLLVARETSNVARQLLLVEVAGGKAAPLAEGPIARFDDPHFGKDGRTVLALSDRGADVRRLVSIDLATGALTPVSSPSPWEVSLFAQSADRSIGATVFNEDGFSRLVLAGADGRPSATQPAGLPRGVVSAVKPSADGSRLAVSLASATSAGDVWSVDTRTGRVERWTASEIGPLDRAALAEPRLVRFPSFDALSVPAFVYRPKRVAADVRTPVLVSIHGGPEAQSLPSWNPSTQFYADVLGATVIVPNVRGSDGYGRAYLDMDNGPKREDSVKDIGALLDWIAAQPDLDPKRVALIGGSYSGYVVLAALELYGDRLAGGVESFGITDFVSFLEHTESYRRDNRRAEYGDERDPAMRAVFERISPLKNVAKIGKPLLVQQGVNDPRVPKSESDQIVAALRGRGVPVPYLVFADEGHGFRKKPNQDLSQEVSATFLRQLFQP